jgi:triacylglycerol lipase
MTKYPLLLVHGLGFHDRTFGFNYWGRIPASLEGKGVAVYYGDTDAWGTIRDSALLIARSVDEALAASGAEKVNVIAHSRGGLDCRYLISSLGYADKIASLTTISAPHRGARCLNILHELPPWLVKTAAFFVNLWFRILGDRKPGFGVACLELSEKSVEKFNEANPDAPGVYYRSFGARMASPFNDLMLAATNTILGLVDGDNDGIVAYESMKWTNFGPMAPENPRKGLSHADAVDLRRRDRQGFDIRGFYELIVAALAARGL